MIPNKSFVLFVAVGLLITEVLAMVLLGSYKEQKTTDWLQVIAWTLAINLYLIAVSIGMMLP